TRHVFVRYQYDAAGDLVAVVDAVGNPHRFTYDDHRLVRHTDRLGVSFHYEYELEQSPWPGEWRVVRSWGDGGIFDYRFAYDLALNQRRITDSLGQDWIVDLDERGLPVREIDPLGGITMYEYDDDGRTTAIVDAAGRRNAYAYDD